MSFILEVTFLIWIVWLQVLFFTTFCFSVLTYLLPPAFNDVHFTIQSYCIAHFRTCNKQHQCMCFFPMQCSAVLCCVIQRWVVHYTSSTQCSHEIYMFFLCYFTCSNLMHLDVVSVVCMHINCEFRVSPTLFIPIFFVPINSLI